MIIPNPFTSTISKVLGGLFGVSLLLNVFLFYNGQHQVEKRVECVQAVKTVNAIATQKKVVIEKRQENVSAKTETNLSGRLAAIDRSLQDRGRLPDLSKAPDTSATPDEENSGPILLPQDERDCDINTAVAHAWQDWHAEQMTIEEEENVKPDTKSDPVPSQ